MNHSFNVEIAQNYGIEEAIILENLYFWISKNKANDTNNYDGHYWTYNSINAFQELFPYMSVSKIRRIMEKLENEGLVITGNYNKIAYDRTKWYALTTKALSIYDSSICQNEQIEKHKSTNQFAVGDEPIPDINTDINTDINQIREAPPKKKFIPPKQQEVDEYIREIKNNGHVVTFTAETFINSYESKGWMVGKNKMKNWKAAIRTWLNRQNYYSGNSAIPQQRQLQSFEEKAAEFHKLYGGIK